MIVMLVRIREIAFSLSAAIGAMCMSCESELPPTPVPEPEYTLGEEWQGVEWSAGEVTVELEWETSDENLQMVFLRENKPLGGDEFYQFEHRVFDLGDIFGGLDVMTYCLKQGYDKYPATGDFYVPYEWVEVASCLEEDSRTKVVVRYEENPGPERRYMFLHFFNGKWGCVVVRQDGKPSETAD